MDWRYIIIAIWFSLLTAEVCTGIHLFIVHMRYKSDISTAKTFLGIMLILWCGVSTFACMIYFRTEHEKKIYESKLVEPGIDSDGKLCIVIEVEENDDVYSGYRGDDNLVMVEERAVSHNYLEIFGNHKGAQCIWKYQVAGSGECELYKVIRSPGGGSKTVIKYCISVDEDGNIFQTEEKGEPALCVVVSPYEEYGIWEIDSVVIEKKDGKKEVEGELFEEFISNLIFMYGCNEVCEQPDNIDAMHNVMIRYKGADRYREFYIDNSKNIFEVSGKGTEQEHWEVFHASPYCDMQWLYDWINMVESEES